MSLRPVTPYEMHAAQIFAGGAMALWMLVGLAPGIRAYATQIRAVLLAIYLLGGTAFAVHLLLFR
ncbi:MAG TPA: hypothetical protein VGG99_09070 [Acetobacteraceae bacterium]